MKMVSHGVIKSLIYINFLAAIWIMITDFALAAVEKFQ